MYNSAPEYICLARRFQKWPADALAAVALKFLTEMELDANTRSKLVGLCQAMHTRITQASEGESVGRRCGGCGGKGGGAQRTHERGRSVVDSIS